MLSVYDVLVIGGGAAGLCSAISLKRKKPSLNIAVIEQLSRVGKKLIVTGNGRCNITNEDILLSSFHSENEGFLSCVLENYNKDMTKDFFESLGVVFTCDDRGRIYPYSLQASSVVDALRFTLDELGIYVFTETKMLSYKRDNETFKVTTDKGDFRGKALLITSGLFSGGKKLGSDGSVFNYMKHGGYKTVKTTPAIVQLKTDTDIVKQLKGIKVEANVILKSDNKLIREEFGEVLFCDYGLSGPPIMQVSRAVDRDKAEKTVYLDLMPQYDFSSLYELITSRAKTLKERKLEEFFTGLLNKRVGQVIVKSAGLKLADNVNSLNDANIKKMVSLIKGLPFKVISTTGFENSQVTAGGISLDEFSSDTLMSKREKGLFAAGEILDVDGDCGGFNLQWAWSSAFCAADGIIKYLGGA